LRECFALLFSLGEDREVVMIFIISSPLQNHRNTPPSPFSNSFDIWRTHSLLFSRIGSTADNLPQRLQNGMIFLYSRPSTKLGFDSLRSGKNFFPSLAVQRSGIMVCWQVCYEYCPSLSIFSHLNNRKEEEKPGALFELGLYEDILATRILEI